MKRVIFLCFLITSLNNGFAQQNSTPYDYPIKPGSAEWKNFKSGDEMAAACNIPDAVVKNLTTQALVITCLNYPLFNEIFSANNLQAGFSALTDGFNGFEELLNRKDAGKELLSKYQSLNPKNLTLLSSPEEKGDFTFRYTFIELLLSQDQIISGFTQSERQSLRQEAIKKFEQKKELIDDFGVFGLNNSAWVLGKLLQVEKKPLPAAINEQDLNFFLSTGTFSNKEILDAIYIGSKSL
ncbi:MAG: hypothetical protein QM763_24835 [Agriterribacter sp.]